MARDLCFRGRTNLEYRHEIPYLASALGHPADTLLAAGIIVVGGVAAVVAALHSISNRGIPHARGSGAGDRDFIFAGPATRLSRSLIFNPLIER